MLIRLEQPLRDKHSFHLEVQTRYWVEYDTIDELKAILLEANTFGLPILPIGAGCNLVFLKDYEGILLHSLVKGREVVETTDETVLVKVGAGEDWDQWVEFAVEQGWGGLENLSGIPGSVGASPVQNIGAYGAEAADCIHSVELFDRQTLETRSFPAADCAFGYRDSRFKHDWKDRYIVVSVTFRLNRRPQYRLSYGALQAQTGPIAEGNTPGEIKDNLRRIRQSVLDIRQSKLPDIREVGSAGSFFKNPVVDKDLFHRLHPEYPDMPYWYQADDTLKLSAAWLIEQCGWKGRRDGDAGVWPKQALVLVNYGHATPDEIDHLRQAIENDVEARFGIRLEPEAILL